MCQQLPLRSTLKQRPPCPSSLSASTATPQALEAALLTPHLQWRIQLSLRAQSGERGARPRPSHLNDGCTPPAGNIACVRTGVRMGACWLGAWLSGRRCWIQVPKPQTIKNKSNEQLVLVILPEGKPYEIRPFQNTPRVSHHAGDYSRGP